MRKVAKSAFDLTNFESDLNRLGYRFLSEGKLSAAVEILKLCVEEFPVSANAYDSLGEAYFANKEYKLSLVNYQKSRELNPENENAGVMIKRIQTILEGN
jgi:tetratricopeptide (TPR) repeat protein